MDMWGHNPWGNRRPDLSVPPSRTARSASRTWAAWSRRSTPPASPAIRWSSTSPSGASATGFEDKDLLQDLSAKTADKWIRAGFEIAEWKRIYTLGWVHPTDTERNSTACSPRAARESTLRDIQAVRLTAKRE